jgi:8-oxo-dGTP pyrophosphatase MutT (NUDIX family)
MVKERLRELLAGRQKCRISDADRVPAAVLVPLYIKQGQYHILFIRRTETVRVHQGQISFPGGHREASDGTLLDTALRECAEEIGLQTGDVEVLGELDDEITTTSNYIVSPFVAVIPCPYGFTLNRHEVAALIEAPVAALLGWNYHHQETLPDGRVFDSYAYHYQGQIIWGATARILKRLLDIFAQAEADSETTP